MGHSSHSSSGLPRLTFGNWLFLIGLLIGSCQAGSAQPSSNGATIQKIDAAVAARDENLLGYTVTETYRVFRGAEKTHASAEMTVKTSYRKDAGKSYVILSQTGSELLLNEVLGRVLESERLMTQPANRVQAVLTSGNYTMRLKGNESVDGRDCTAVAIVPKRSSPYLFRGSIWVDAQDGSIVKLEGVASRSASILTGATQVSRQYEKIDRLPMATHATAVASSWLLGQTTIDIDYSDYQMTLRNAAGRLQSVGQAGLAGSHE
jgi:outer membrane lipoprotein-sorting protein